MIARATPAEFLIPPNIINGSNYVPGFHLMTKSILLGITQMLERLSLGAGLLQKTLLDYVVKSSGLIQGSF